MCSVSELLSISTASSPFARADDQEKRGVGANCDWEEGVKCCVVRSEEGGFCERGAARAVMKRRGEGVWMGGEVSSLFERGRESATDCRRRRHCLSGFGYCYMFCGCELRKGMTT